MPEQMVTVPITGRIDQPVEGETSRSMPDQVGNVAGATTSELHDRLLQTNGRTFIEGPLKKVYAFWLSGMSCDGCSISTLGATEPAAEELHLLVERLAGVEDTGVSKIQIVACDRVGDF